MKNSSNARLNVAVLMGILLCSSVTMLWLFWRFPIATAVATLLILAGFSLATRLAVPSDGETFVDLDAHEQGIRSH
jgi:hypothetical protein